MSNDHSPSNLKPFLLNKDDQEKDDLMPQTPPIIRCVSCGRPLKNAKSIDRKMGYTCWKKTQ